MSTIPNGVPALRAHADRLAGLIEHASRDLQATMRALARAEAAAGGLRTLVDARTAATAAGLDDLPTDGPLSSADGKVIRAWAVREGLLDPAHRGRLPSRLRRGYFAAGEPPVQMPTYARRSNQ